MGLTKLETSIFEKPYSLSRLTNLIMLSVDTGAFSFWSPSHGPISKRVTESVIQRLQSKQDRSVTYLIALGGKKLCNDASAGRP